MPDRIKEEFARSAGARELLERLPNLGTKQSAFKFLQQATQYDDVLFSNDMSDLVQKMSDSKLITPEQRREYASFKANRAVELASDPEKRKYFVDREFRPDLTPDQIEKYRVDKQTQLANEAAIDRSNTKKYLGALGYTPEDVYRFGPDTSGFLNENIPLVGGAELPIMSRSFTGAESANQFNQALPIAGGVISGAFAPLGAFQDRLMGNDSGNVFNPSDSPLVAAGEAAGSEYADRVASMPGTLIGGDLGAMAGGALASRAVKGKYRGLGILLGTVLGAAGGGTVGTNINQQINENAMGHLIGAAAMAKRREAKEFNAANYSQAARIGSLAGDMTFFAPSLKVPGVGVRKAVGALSKRGTKALKTEGVRETVYDIADRATEFTQGVFESYQQSEEQKRQGLPGLTPWQILGDGAVGALLSGETKLGRAMTEPYNRLKSPEFMISNLNKLANKRAEVKADRAVRRETQMREQEGTIAPTESRYRRFNLGGRLSGDVNADGQPIIKGAEYAIYDPEKRRAFIYTDNDFVLEGYRSKNAADSLTSTEFIFKRTPLIEYTDKAAGVRRSILGISRDAGVVVKDVGPDGQARISTVPITDIRNEKIATRIENVMTEHGVKPNDKPAPFMPEAYENFNKQVFDAEVTLDPSLPAFPARVVKQVNQKRQGMYIVALPDGTHMRVHESQINIDEPGAVVARGQVQEQELPRSLSDLIPPEKILKNQWKFGQGSENEAVLELTPEQLTTIGKIRRKYSGDLEAIKGIRDKNQRAAAIELNLARIAKEAESVLSFEGPSPRYKRGDVIDVNTSQFGEQTAIVVGQNKYGHIVRLVDHPRIGSFTVQPSSIKGELSRREAEAVLGGTPSATQGEYTNPDFDDEFESEPVEPIDVKEETVGAPKLEADHEKVDEIELSPYTKGKLAQQLSDFLENSDVADDIRDGDFSEGEVAPETPEIIDAEIIDAEIIDNGEDENTTGLLGEKPKDVVDTGTGTGLLGEKPRSVVDTGAGAGTDTGTSAVAIAPGVVIHSTEHEVRRAMRDKPNIEGLNVEFVPIRYEAKYSPARGEAVQEFVGRSPIINYNDRKVVLVYINGVQVPFYCSSGLGGKKDVPPGKWYPFFGISNGSWFNKASGTTITSYYGSPEFAKVAQYLDNTLGDVRAVTGMTKVGLTFNRQIASHVKQINQGLSPAENERPDTAEKLQANIDETLRRVREAVAKSESPSASEYIDPDSIATDDVESIAKLTKTNGQLDGFVDGKRPLGKYTQLQLPGFKSTGAYLNGKLFTSMGNAQTYTSEIFNYSDRVITVVDINGAKIPFYCSTGHNPKDGVIPGQWYPFFGLGENWLNKGSSAAMSEYYGIPSLREVSESLDAKYGDVRKLVGYDAGINPVDARLQNLVIPNYDGGSWGRRNAKNLVDFTNQSFDNVINNVAEASANRNWLNERLAPLMSALKGEGATDTGTDTGAGDEGESSANPTVSAIINAVNTDTGTGSLKEKLADKLKKAYLFKKAAFESFKEHVDGDQLKPTVDAKDILKYKQDGISDVLALLRSNGFDYKEAADLVRLFSRVSFPDGDLLGNKNYAGRAELYADFVARHNVYTAIRFDKVNSTSRQQLISDTRSSLNVNINQTDTDKNDQYMPLLEKYIDEAVNEFARYYPEVSGLTKWLSTSTSHTGGEPDADQIRKQKAVDSIGLLKSYLGVNTTNDHETNITKIVEGAHNLGFGFQNGEIILGRFTSFNEQVPVIKQLLNSYLKAAYDGDTEKENAAYTLATDVYKKLYEGRTGLQRTITERFFKPQSEVVIEPGSAGDEVFMAKRPSFAGRAANRTKDGFIVTVKNTVLNVKINRDAAGDVRVRMEMTQYDPKKKNVTGQAVTEYTAKRQRGGEWHVFNTVYGDQREASAFFTVKGSDRDFMRNLIRGMVNHSIGIKNSNPNWKSATDVAVEQSPEAQRKASDLSARKAEAEAKRAEAEANKEKQRQANKEKWQAELALREKLAEQANEIKREELRVKQKTAETSAEITDLKDKLEKLQAEIGASAQQASDDLKAVKDQLTDVTDRLRKAKKKAKEAKNDAEKRQAEAVEKALESQAKKHKDDMAALQRIVDGVQNADKLATSQLEKKIEQLINQVIEQQKELAGRSVQLSTDTTDNDSRINALLAQMRMIESQHDAKIDELNAQINELTKQLSNVGTSTEKPKRVKKETVYKESEIDSIVQNREIVTVLKEINGTQYKLDATIVNNRTQLKTILHEQYGYTKTGAYYWSGIVDHFARAWAVRQLASRQRVRDMRPSERTTSEGDVELVMHRVLRQDEETVKSLAMLMREFYRDRFAAFAYVTDLSKLDDIGYGATFKAAREDGTSFNVITAFASRDEETGVHEIAHALLRGMDKPYRDKLLAQMQRLRASAGVFKDSMPIDAEELFVGMFVSSLRNEIVPVVQGNYDSGDARVESKDLELFWKGTGKYLNEVLSTVTGKNIKNQTGNNLTQWVAPFDPSIRLFTGMQVYVRKDGEDHLAIVTKPDPKDKAAYDTYRTSYAPEGKVEVHIAGDQNPVLIDRGDISNLGGLTQGFNPGMLETLSKYLGAYYRESDANIWKSVKHLMEDFNDTLVPSTGTSESITTGEDNTTSTPEPGDTGDQQEETVESKAQQIYTKSGSRYRNEPIVFYSSKLPFEEKYAFLEKFPNAIGIESEVLTDAVIHRVTGIPYSRIPSQTFAYKLWLPENSFKGGPNRQLTFPSFNGNRNQYSTVKEIRDVKPEVLAEMRDRINGSYDASIESLMRTYTTTQVPRSNEGVKYGLHPNHTTLSVLQDLSSFLNDPKLLELSGQQSAYSLLKYSKLDRLPKEVIYGRIFMNQGVDGLVRLANLALAKPMVDSVFKYDAGGQIQNNLNWLLDHAKQNGPLSDFLNDASTYVIDPKTGLTREDFIGSDTFDYSTLLAMSTSEISVRKQLLSKMELSNDKRSRINDSTLDAMARSLDGLYDADSPLKFAFNHLNKHFSQTLRYREALINGTDVSGLTDRQAKAKIMASLSLNYLADKAKTFDDKSSGKYDPYARDYYLPNKLGTTDLIKTEMYLDAVNSELKEGIVDLFRHNDNEGSRTFRPAKIDISDGVMTFNRVKAQQGYPTGTFRVNLKNGDTQFKPTGSDVFTEYTSKAKVYNPENISPFKERVNNNARMLYPKRSWVTGLLLAQLNNKIDQVRSVDIPDIALSAKMPKIKFTEAERNANVPVNSPEVKAELKPIIESMVKSGRFDGNTAYDSRGKVSNLHNLYQNAAGLSSGAALLNYARTETKAFKKWSGNNPVVEAIATSDLRPNVTIGEISPAVRTNIRKYMAGKAIVKFAKSLNGTLTPEDAVELEVLMDDYLRGETTLTEIRQGIDAAIDEPAELQALIDTVEQQISSSKFEVARLHMSDSDTYSDAATRPRTGRPLVTVGFAPNKTLAWLRSAGGFVMSGGPSDQTGYNKYGYYLRVDNPLVVDLDGQGVDAVSVEQMFAKNPTRDGIVFLNAKHSIGGLNTTHNIILPRSEHAKLPWTTWTDTKPSAKVYPSEFDYILRDKSQDEWMKEDEGVIYAEYDEEMFDRAKSSTGKRLSDDQEFIEKSAALSNVRPGQIVATRLNINFLRNYNVPVQSVHKTSVKAQKPYNGEVIAYSHAITLKNPSFMVDQKAVYDISSGVKNKFPMAAVMGEYVPVDPSKHRIDGEVLSFNPNKTHLFIDSKGNPVKAVKGTVTSYKYNVYVHPGSQIEYWDENAPKRYVPDNIAFMGRMPDINYRPDYTGKAEPAAPSMPMAETPMRVRKTRTPDTADKLTSIVDFINDITRLTLSSDLAFMTLQAGIISLSNPAIGFKAFLMAMRGFAPNLKVEWFGGVGHRKLGREVFHDIGDAMRQNPAYELAREAGLPLGMFEIDERYAEALSIELHNLRRINPDATIDDCRTTLMDIDELGTNDEWFIKNRLSRHLPGQGQFERFNAILHDQILLLAFDNWHKQFLAMGYVEGSEKMKRALKDGARILAVTTGDVAYSTNKQRDATAGRIAKLLFTAPRWVMSRALVDPLINSVLSSDSFSLLHDLMGHDNPVWNLYKGDQAAAALGRTMYGRLVGGQIFMMILAILWQNFNPETEVETDITRQAGRIRVGDFRLDPPAGLFDHYRLGYRLMEAALQTSPADAKKAKKSDGTILEKIASDLGREVSYKASPMLNMAVGMFQTGKTPIGEPMFGQNEAAAHVYNQLILPRLIEVNGGIQPWMTDVRVSNAFIERLPTGVSQFIDSYYAADKYGADPLLYASINTGLNNIGLKTELKPVKALKERKRRSYQYDSTETPTAKSVIEQQGLLGLIRGQD